MMNRSLLGHWEARPRATRHLYGLHFHPTWQLAHFELLIVLSFLLLSFTLTLIFLQKFFIPFSLLSLSHSLSRFWVDRITSTSCVLYVDIQTAFTVYEYSIWIFLSNCLILRISSICDELFNPKFNNMDK